MQHNPLFAIDFYKVDHRRQYPEGTTEIYSNFTPRYVHRSSNMLHDFDNQVVVFGIQAFIKDYLIEQWNDGFFNRDKFQIVSEYKALIERALGLDDFDCSHIEALHDLGYLPIRIKAIDEGLRVPIGVPVLTIVNTHPDFYWLTNYLETIISASIWKPITVATIAFEFKRLMARYAEMTGCQGHVVYQVHDFSFRGMSGWADAIICGAAHLTSFEGTDNVTAIDFMQKHYDGEYLFENIGNSVPATEHSVICCNGSEGEFDTIRRLITEVYPDGIVSIVADSYDLWKTLTVYLPSLYKEINARHGKVVIRPDSGNPFDIICGDSHAEEGTPAQKGALQLLWETFGGRVNDAGYKELSPRIGLIYGDAITVDVARNILREMQYRGFASNNIVFGVGSYSYQYITRDTFGFAMKATSAVVDGKRRPIFKDPITADGSKKSARGLLRVQSNIDTGLLELDEDVSQMCESMGMLQVVFEDGKLLLDTNLSQIRLNLAVELKAILD